MSTWNPTKIRWIDEPLASSTGAARAETDRGPAYVKLMGNPEGPQALFCELLGTRAAAWLGLPTFDVAVVNVDEAGLVTYENGTRSEAGPAFAAHFEDGTAWGGTAEELNAVENPEVFAGLVVLDTWLLNCDRYRPGGNAVKRNTRNVFLSARDATKGKLRAIAMDHTHCLACGRELTKAIAHIDRIKDERLYGHFPEFKEHLTHERVRTFSQRLSTFRKEDAEKLLYGMPGAWRKAPDVQGATIEFLSQRAGFVAQNVRKMLLNEGYLERELELEG